MAGDAGDLSAGDRYAVAIVCAELPNLPRRKRGHAARSAGVGGRGAAEVAAALRVALAATFVEAAIDGAVRDEPVVGARGAELHVPLRAFGGLGTLGTEHDNPCELCACVVRQGLAISDRR